MTETNNNPGFVAKPARPGWANWLIVAAILFGATLLFTVSGAGLWLAITGIGVVVSLIAAAVTALMSIKQ